MAKNFYVREQKHICGADAQTAPYMEVDLFEITPAQHRANRRAKREMATSLVKQKYNEEMSRRYFVQLVNTNFKPGDYSLTLTYDDDNLPQAGDTERVDRDFSNFVKRIYRWCDKRGIARPAWVVVSEYCSIGEDGRPVGRHHNHAIMQKVEGLTRDDLEKLWCDRHGEKLGLTRCDPLDFDHGSIEGLARYITKNKRCKRKWRQSRGLKKPITPPPNDTKWSRKKLNDAAENCLEDAAYWEQKYPGYTLHRAARTVTGNGTNHLVVQLYRKKPPNRRTRGAK